MWKGVSFRPYGRTFNANKRFPTKIWRSWSLKVPWAVIDAVRPVEDHLVVMVVVVAEEKEEAVVTVAEVVDHHHRFPSKTKNGTTCEKKEETTTARSSVPVLKVAAKSAVLGQNHENG